MLLITHLLTASALLFSFAPAPQTEGGRERALALVERLGGTYEVDAEAAGSPVVKVDLHGTALSDDDVEALAALKGLRHLDLRLTKIGDKGVAHLRGLKDLRFLNLFRTQVGDRGLGQLKELAALETLLIGRSKVTEGGAKALQKELPKLRFSENM